jgi:lipopolysaccharide biosynthesis glycosyltransferase
MDNIIPIAMCTDQNFILPIIVLVTSLLQNAGKNTFFRLYLLTSGDILPKDTQKLLDLEQKYGNLELVIINMDQKLKQNYTGFIKSNAAIYRLKLASLLPNEEKCIYLDGDTIILQDLSHLFKINIEDYYLAGCLDFRATFKQKLFRPLQGKYINSGVLLMNLKKIREDNLEQKFEELLEKNNKQKLFYFVDQDIINLACVGKIKFLPIKYNSMSHLYLHRYWNLIANKYYTCAQWREGLQNPVIVHYTFICPWKGHSGKFDGIWWYYAKISGYLEEIRNKYKIKGHFEEIRNKYKMRGEAIK